MYGRNINFTLLAPSLWAVVEAIASNIDEEINSAGDGSGVALPPAFVIVQPRVHRRMKKNNGDKVDGRTSGAKALFTRIQKRKMKEQVEEKSMLLYISNHF